MAILRKNKPRAGTRWAYGTPGRGDYGQVEQRRSGLKVIKSAPQGYQGMLKNFAKKNGKGEGYVSASGHLYAGKPRKGTKPRAVYTKPKNRR
ncbi:hypothetical protein ACRQFN_02260 [Actinotignum sp. GS-2025e]|uniref:hypothetical protein n=1 Tax=unclassified Actinotignum TaxID=2632702 RepID=UPI003F4775EF